MLLTFILAQVLITGCSADTLGRKVVFTTGFSDNEVFRIEDVSCSLTETMVYLVNMQNGYEATFGSEIWRQQTDSGTVEDRLKESVLAKVAQIKVMNLLASENGIELDESELEKAKSAAEEYYETLSDSDKEAMNNVTVSDLAQIMAEQALANKLYDYIIRDINPEISDDEARTITVEQIFVKTYNLDQSGNKVPFEEKDKARAHDRIREAFIKLMNGGDFDEVLEQYNEADEGTISFGKGEMDSAYETAAFNLGTDEVSGIVETRDGYVIIKCISTFNREETETNKVKIMEQRKREVFGKEYDAFVETLTKELNSKLWYRVSLMTDSDATSSKLMDIYHKHYDN